MLKKTIVSICIPTNNRAEIIKETLESIFFQNVDDKLYEVCISDGSSTDETKEIIEKYFKDYKNIKYVKSHCETPYNLIEALKLGKGEFLKLHNDYSKFKNGELINFIDSIEKYSNNNALMFFPFGEIKNKIETIELKSFDEFMNNISYYSTWSSAFCIDKKNFDILIDRQIDIEKMFPHLSLLYACYDKDLYVIDNNCYVSNIPLKKKGGYNLPETFVKIYLSMTKDLLRNQKISLNTYNKIRKGTLKFVADWYAIVKTDKRYFFTFENLEQYLSEYYTKAEIKKFYCYHYLYLNKLKLKRLIKSIIK